MPTRVILDTCIVRGEMHSPRDLSFLGCDAVAVSIPDIAIAEIVVALLEQRIGWNAFKSGIASLGPILDPDLPILVTGNDLAFMVGLIPEDPSPGFPGPHLGRAIWRLVSRASTPAELAQGTVFRGQDGIDRRVSLNLAGATHILDEARSTWIHGILDACRLLVPQPPSQSDISRAVLDGMRLAYGSKADRFGDLAVALARFYSMALAERTPYNPSSSDRRGDAFDFALLQALALPSVICTMDNRLIRHMRHSGARGSCQLLTIEELRIHVLAGTLDRVCPPWEPVT